MPIQNWLTHTPNSQTVIINDVLGGTQFTITPLDVHRCLCADHALRKPNADLSKVRIPAVYERMATLFNNDTYPYKFAIYNMATKTIIANSPPVDRRIFEEYTRGAVHTNPAPAQQDPFGFGTLEPWQKRALHNTFWLALEHQQDTSAKLAVDNQALVASSSSQPTAIHAAGSPTPIHMLTPAPAPTTTPPPLPSEPISNISDLFSGSMQPINDYHLTPEEVNAFLGDTDSMIATPADGNVDGDVGMTDGNGAAEGTANVDVANSGVENTV